MCDSKLTVLKALIAACLCMCADTAHAAPRAVASVVDIMPGADIYELEGHTALRLQWADGRDLAISYGTFDFNAPNFAYRFVKGETDYWVSAIPWMVFEDAYIAQGRTMVQHTLDLDSLQTERLIALIEENLQPENATYRYNYVKDNCATRPMAIIEKALGDTISYPGIGDDTSMTTYRRVMERYHANYPWYQLGIDLALGGGIDYPISNREKIFAPVLLEQQLDRATVGGRPLVSGTQVLYSGSDVTLPPTPWYLTPDCVCWLLLALVALVSWRQWRRRGRARWLDALLFGVYGLLGCLLTFLIVVSEHEATSPNWLWLWLNPLCLLVPLLVWCRRGSLGARLLTGYMWLNLALIAVMALCWPFIAQRGNSAFIPLVLADVLRSALYILNSNKKHPTARK